MTSLAVEPLPGRVLSADKLATTHAFVEQVIGRQLRHAERSIDVLRLNGALNHAKAEITAAVKDEQRLAARRALLNGGRVRLNVTRQMLRPLERLLRLGREEALAELRRAGYQPRDPAPLKQRSYEDAHLRHGYEALDPLAQKIRSRLDRIGILIHNGVVTADLSEESSLAIARALMLIPGGKDLASRIVSTALTAGLAQTFEANQDLIACWEYTAVLDSNTCEECEPLDGTEYQSLDELYQVLPDFGPNPLCLGEGRCRCRAVPCG